MREIGGCTINTEQCTYNVCSMQGGEGDGGGQKKSTMKDGEGKRKLESVYPPSEEEEERKRVWKGGERKCVDCVIAAKRRSFPPYPTPNPIAYLSRQTILFPPPFSHVQHPFVSGKNSRAQGVENIHWQPKVASLLPNFHLFSEKIREKRVHDKCAQLQKGIDRLVYTSLLPYIRNLFLTYMMISFCVGSDVGDQAGVCVLTD